MRLKLIAILALAALTVLALACGDDDDDGGGATTAATTAAATDAPSATGDTPDNGDSSLLAINIENFTFDPADFTVPADEDITITLTNADSAAHTFTVYTDADFTEAEGTNIGVRSNASAEGQGNFEAGEYFFRCDFHPDSMQGTFTAE
jgi:plastocyanin